MPQIKILPPNRLPETSISEQDFEDWVNELEIWLGGDDTMARFMRDGIYRDWQSLERNPDRLDVLNDRDPDRPAAEVANRDDVVAELLRKRRRELKTFIGQVARCASKGLYSKIVRHSTSLEWVYTTIREDYDIQQKGVHFLNILDLKYDSEKQTPAAFYNEYRTVLMNNIGRRDDIIRWNGNQQLAADEVIGPLTEDIILLDVIRLINPHLP